MWYREKIDFDKMSMEELVEFFKDKQFFMYSCNDPSWNRALVRIREKYGEVKQDPSTGWGIDYGIK